MNMKKLIALLLAAVLCCGVLTACGGEGGSGTPAYKVSVVDELGNPYTEGVVVKFMQNGQQVAMQVVDENGVAERTMDAGDYTVELQFTSNTKSYYYDTADLTLSADKKELQVVVAYALGEESKPLGVGDVTYEAYNVTAGCTRVKLSDSGMSYFLFTPTEAGTYEFSLHGSDAAIGYYGGTHFVQDTPLTEVVDNKFQVSVSAGMIGTDDAGTSVLVIGVAASQTDATLAIERIGDPAWSIEDEPWDNYQTTAELKQYELPAGAQIGEFDLTASTDTYNLVYNEADGYYHLDSADGPLVLVRLGSKAEVKYLDPFQTILEHSGVNRYFYDADGNFERKENYSDCLLEYFDYVHEESGLYPLTEDLKYIIQQRGEYVGWWDSTSSGYIFFDSENNMVPGINADIAWLFMCCYIAG